MFSPVSIKIPRGVWLTLGAVLVLGCSHLGVYFHGKSVVQTKWDQSVERGKQLVEDLKKMHSAIDAEVITVYVPKVKVIHEKAKTIEKLVPIYLPADTPDLPPGFRVLHDAAATNTIPSTTAGVGAFPVAVEDVATTMNFNYELCHQERAKLDSLWEWAIKQRHAYLELCKQPGVKCN